MDGFGQAAGAPRKVSSGSVSSAAPRVLAVVPARGGSKGIPRKNLQLLAGRPLVVHAVETARAAGAEVPFLRPVELAQDHSEDWAVFKHTLDWLLRHEGWQPDLVVNLRPTSPMRTPSHVDRAIELLLETGADSVKAVCLARQHPHKMWLRRPDGRIEPFLKTPFRLVRGPDVPRAQLEDVYWQNGVVDVTRREVILEQGVMIGPRVAGLVTQPEESIDIDTPLDLALAELLFSRRMARA